MEDFTKINKDFNKAITAIWNLQDAFKSLMEERHQAILAILEISELLNCDSYSVAHVTFKRPIQIEFVDEGEVLTETVISIVSDVEYYLYTIDGEEIGISYVTAKSLRAIQKAMESGIWDICLSDSDEDFYDLYLEKYDSGFFEKEELSS